MAKKAFNAIKAGLEDAIAFAKGDASRGKAHRIELPPLDVRSLRERVDMSQERFARAFMVSVATVRNWEQGRRVPEGPARVLLHIIDREPAAVLRALRSARDDEPKGSAA